MTVTTEQLSRVPFFRDVPRKSLQRLAKITRERDFEPGDVIIQEGDEGVGFVLIKSGKVNVTRGQAALNSLGAGDFFGEMALLDKHRRSATVRASEPVKTYAMLRSDFMAELESSSELAMHVLASMSRRLREADAKLTD